MQRLVLVVLALVVLAIVAAVYILSSVRGAVQVAMVQAPVVAAAQAAAHTLTGPVYPQSGEVIRGARITSTAGHCIIIGEGVRDVIIEDSEIGPCTAPGNAEADGIYTQKDSSHITVRRNRIHDVSSGMFVNRSKHPIYFDRNYVYNIRGPMPRGQMIQFAEVTGGTAGSTITCNVSDQQGSAVQKVEDHINLWNTEGLADAPTEIAYNRLRGGSSKSGAGINSNDGGGGNAWVHHNTVVNVGNVGISIAGGRNTVVEDNRIFGDGKTSLSGVGIGVTNWYPEKPCEKNVIRRNRVYSIDSAWQVPPAEASLWDSGKCSNTTLSGNVLADKTLHAELFDEAYVQCQ